MTTPPTFALFVVSSLLALPALGADQLVRETGEFESDPALRVAWLAARQRDGGAAYSFAPSGGVFRGHNAAHGFSVALDAGAVRLGGGGAWFTLALDGVGRAGDLQTPPAIGAVASDGQKVSWHRGALTEWYLNGPLGLEQGFDLRKPFPGTGEVVLSLVVSGDVTPVAAGDSVRLATDQGPTWELGDLLVVDARGRRLPSRMTVSGDRVALRFDDAAAVYPVLVDPFLTVEQDKLVASDEAGGDNFGFSVAVSGDTAVVGSPGDDDGGADSGSAYVFVRSGTTWTEQDKLVAGDAAASDTFGWSVAVSGDTAVVGAPLDDDGGSGSGSAYVFVRSGTIWTEQDKLVAGDAAADDDFGSSVAISGDTAIVGSPDEDHGWPEQGAAYVYVRSGTTWSQQRKIVASDGETNDRFGWSVAVSGDTAVVGSPSHAHVTGPAGSAYVFVRSGETWTEQDELQAGDPAGGDFFGFSVAVSGDTAVVGSPFDDHGQIDRGSAYVYARNGTTWSQQRKIVASDPRNGDRFGTSVAVSGDMVVVGSPRDDDGGDESGSAYVFVRSGATWTDAKVVAGDAAAADEFGASVAVSGDTVVAGARFDDDGGSDSGSAYALRVVFDEDLDGIANLDDNCPFVANPGQEDADSDGLGDACDDTDGLDLDDDGIANLDDNCPFTANPGQEDADSDDLGDACDDTDGLDADGDGVANLDDNCPFTANPGQEDADADDLGDACDDTDNSGGDDTGDDTGDDSTGDSNGCGCASPGIPAVSPSLLLGMALLIRRRPRPSP